ncbi:unnamed protein product, partial [Symbiodinium pilosum]
AAKGQLRRRKARARELAVARLAEEACDRAAKEAGPTLLTSVPRTSQAQKQQNQADRPSSEDVTVTPMSFTHMLQNQEHGLGVAYYVLLRGTFV